MNEPTEAEIRDRNLSEQIRRSARPPQFGLLPDEHYNDQSVLLRLLDEARTEVSSLKDRVQIRAGHVMDLQEAKTRIEAERDAARAENDALRGIAAKVMPCHYCGAENIAKCPHGFPGCALADDMACAEESATAALRAARAEAEANRRDAEQGWAAFYTLRKAVSADKYPTLTQIVRIKDAEAAMQEPGCE